VEKYMYTPVWLATYSLGFVNNKITKHAHALAIYVNSFTFA
jgi:hypothetical protein